MYGEDEADDRRRNIREEIQEFRDRVYGGQWVVGELRSHGEANYKFDPDADKSYYVKLRVAHGEETLWGKGLKEAVENSKSRVKVGRRVGMRIREKEPLPGARTFNHWQVERPEFIERQRLLAREILENPVSARRRGREHPELAGSYLVIRGAELLAKNRFTNEKDREQFVQRVREAIGLAAEPFKPRPTPAQPARELDAKSNDRFKTSGAITRE